MGWMHHKTFALGSGSTGAQRNAHDEHPAPERPPQSDAWQPSRQVFVNAKLAADPSPTDAAVVVTTAPPPVVLVSVPGVAEKNKLGLEKKQVCGRRGGQSYPHP
jgi:hypothetical protein